MDLRRQGRRNLPAIHQVDTTDLCKMWGAGMRRLVQDPETGCHVWTGSTQNGYPSISRGHAKSKIKVHMLALYLRKGVLPDPKTVVSHLCHNKKCCNPDHLIIESISSNNDRKACMHSLVDTAGVKWTLCRHTPKCLRADSENLSGFVPSVCD